jgi:hypothetical protein
MNLLNLFDGNNFARVQFEADPGGLPLRNLFVRAFQDPLPGIFVFDGVNSKAMRRVLYPMYKEGRKPAPDSFYLMLGFYKELLMHTNKTLIEVPGFEADDVIATLVLANPELNIVIDSTDRDFCALENERVTTPKANLKGVERKDVRLYKTLVGDTSDKIGGIRLFGPKFWGTLDIKHRAHWIETLTKRELQMADYDRLGLTRELHRNWLAHNHELLQTFWDIVGFYDVPMELINKHTKFGTPNHALAMSKLEELMQ